MIDLGTKAFKDAMDKNVFDIIKRKFTGVANGRTINGYFEMNSQGERIIKTWWISN